MKEKSLKNKKKSNKKLKLSKEDAFQMLFDNKSHGKRLTDKQKEFFHKVLTE